MRITKKIEQAFHEAYLQSCGWPEEEIKERAPRYAKGAWGDHVRAGLKAAFKTASK